MAWNRSDDGSAVKKAQKMRKPSAVRGLVAGLAVVLLAIVAYMFVGRESAPRPPSERAPEAPKVKKPVSSAPAVVSPSPEEGEKESVLPEPPKVKAPKPTKYLGTVTTQRFDRTVTLLDGTVTNLVRKPLFKNQMEQFVSMALNPRGIAVPLRLALRRYSEKQILDMFHTDVKPEPGDSDLLLERKLELQELKIEARNLEKQGYTCTEILNEIDKIGKNTRAEVRDARQGLCQLVKAGESKEVVNAWVKEKNATLKELGVPEIRVPAGYEMDEPSQPAAQ